MIADGQGPVKEINRLWPMKLPALRRRLIKRVVYAIATTYTEQKLGRESV
jgi:hypothetical protein